MQTIPGHENYKITKTGKVFSVAREVFNGRGYYKIKGKWLKSHLGHTGHIMYNITIPSQGKNKSGWTINKLSMSAGHLAALTYIGEPGRRQEVLHIDGNIKNNYYKNLRWVSHTEASVASLAHKKRKKYVKREKIKEG
jgi:hypothetical protein